MSSLKPLNLSSSDPEPAVRPAHSLTCSSIFLFQSYMEDHLKNKDRLEQEWEALCAYQAEPNARTVGMKDGNAKKNRSTAVVACKQANPNCIWFVFMAASVSFTSRAMQTKSTKFGQNLRQILIIFTSRLTQCTVKCKCKVSFRPYQSRRRSHVSFR